MAKSNELIISPTFVLREADGEGTVSDLLGKQVLLVQEKDDGGIDEPLVVANRIKELHGLHHAVHFFVLGQDEVVSREGHTKDDGSHTFEAMDPLFALRSLATHVEHPAK